MEWIAILNIVLPQAFGFIGDLRRQDPTLSYKDALIKSGLKVDAEVLQLVADMAKAVEEGAVPRGPSTTQEAHNDAITTT